MKNIVLTSIILLLFVLGLKAQENSDEQVQLTKSKDIMVSASWTVAVPLGDMNDFVRSTSGRGFQFDLHQFINDRFSCGGSFSWQAFYEKDFKIYQYEQSAYAGWQRNYINAFFIMGSAKYNFATSANKIKAYLSIEVGASIIENNIRLGIYETKELEWHFALIPALGVEIPVTKNLGFNMHIKFPNSFKNNSSIHYSWLNTGVGMYVIIPN